MARRDVQGTLLITLLETAAVASSSVKSITIVNVGAGLPVEASLVQLLFLFLYFLSQYKVTLENNNDISTENLAGG